MQVIIVIVIGNLLGFHINRLVSQFFEKSKCLLFILVIFLIFYTEFFKKQYV